MPENKDQIIELPVICNKYWIGNEEKKHLDNDYLFRVVCNDNEYLISLYAVLEALHSFAYDSLQKALNKQLGLFPPIAEGYWNLLDDKNPNAFIHQATGGKTETTYIGFRYRYEGIVQLDLMFRDNSGICRFLPLTALATIVQVAVCVLELIPEPIADRSVSKRLAGSWLRYLLFITEDPKDLPTRSSLVLATHTFPGVEGTWTVVAGECFHTRDFWYE